MAILNNPTYTFRRSKPSAWGVSLKLEMVVDPSVVGMPVNWKIDEFGTTILDLVDGEIYASKGYWRTPEVQRRIEGHLVNEALPPGVLCYSVEMWTQTYSISLTSYPS